MPRKPPRPGSYLPMPADLKLNIVLNKGGLGDHICRMVAVVHLLNNYPVSDLHLYGPEFFRELAEYWLAPFGDRATYKDIKDWATSETRPSYWFNQDFHTTMGTHLVDNAFHILLDQAVMDNSDRNYLAITGAPSTPLPEKFIILTPGYTAPNRALPGATWNAIAQYVASLGITPVWLGKKADLTIGSQGDFDEVINFNIGVDLRDRTTLMEAARICSAAVAVVGLDNGLIHLSATGPVPIIAAYSSVDPRLRLPIRGGITGKDVWVVTPDTCRGCESFLRFTYDNDTRHCFYGDYICIKQLTYDKFKAAIDDALAGRPYDISTLHTLY